MIENVYFIAHVLRFLAIAGVVGLFAYIVLDEVRQRL